MPRVRIVPGVSTPRGQMHLSMGGSILQAIVSWPAWQPWASRRPSDPPQLCKMPAKAAKAPRRSQGCPPGCSRWPAATLRHAILPQKEVQEWAVAWPKWHQASHLQISTACPAEKSCFLSFYWNIFGHFLRRPVVSGILSHIPSGILSEMDSDIYSDIRSDSLPAMYSDLLSKFLSDLSFEVYSDYMLTVWHLIWQCIWRGEEEDQAYKKSRDPPQIKRETLRVCFVSFVEAIIATLHLFIAARGATSATLWANSCMHTWFEESAGVALLGSASRCILWACARKPEDKCELQMRSHLEKQIRTQKRKTIEIYTDTHWHCTIIGTAHQNSNVHLI